MNKKNEVPWHILSVIEYNFETNKLIISESVCKTFNIDNEITLRSLLRKIHYPDYSLFKNNIKNHYKTKSDFTQQIKLNNNNAYIEIKFYNKKAFATILKIGTEASPNEILLQEDLNINKFLISIASHDLKSPLNSIWGFSELIINNSDTFSKEQITTFIKNIYNSTTISFVFLDLLLYFSRIQTNRLVLEPVDINILETIKEIEESVKPIFSSKGIDFNIFMEKDITISFDKGSFKTILYSVIYFLFKNNKRNSIINCKCIVNEGSLFVSLDYIVDPEFKFIPKELYTIKSPIEKYSNEMLAKFDFGLYVANLLLRKNNGSFHIKKKQETEYDFIVKIPMAN